MNAGPAELQALADEVAALSRKLSCLTVWVTVMNNRLNHEGGLIPVVAAFELGMEIGRRDAAAGSPAAARRGHGRPARARHLKSVPPIGGQQ